MENSNNHKSKVAVAIFVASMAVLGAKQVDANGKEKTAQPTTENVLDECLKTSEGIERKITKALRGIKESSKIIGNSEEPMIANEEGILNCTNMLRLGLENNEEEAVKGAVACIEESPRLQTESLIMGALTNGAQGNPITIEGFDLPKPPSLTPAQQLDECMRTLQSRVEVLGLLEQTNKAFQKVEKKVRSRKGVELKDVKGQLRRIQNRGL